MEKGYADNLIEMFDMVLVGVPKDRREIMKQWAHREMTQKPLIMQCTMRTWVNSYVDEKTDDAGNVVSKSTVPAGWHTLRWEIGSPSLSNPSAMIFAMVQVDEDHVKVYSFQLVEVEGQQDALYFHETLYRPDTTYGSISHDALFEEFANFFATEEELEKLHGAEDGGRPAPEPRANGAAS